MSLFAPAFGPRHQIKVSTGATISYFDTGSGPRATLLFLHGLGTYALSWKPNVAALSARYRCIAVDLPGYGHSSRDNHSYSMPFFAHSVVDFIGRLGLHDVCLVGHSMGGQIAMNAVLEEPQCARRIVLCAPAGFETFNPLERAGHLASLRAMDFFSDDEAMIRHGLHRSFYHFPPDAAQMVRDVIQIFRKQPQAQYKQIIDRCIQGMLEGEVYSRLPQIKHPALVIFGEKDALIPAKFFSHRSTRQLAEEGAARMPKATLHVLPRAGHFVHWEKATVVNRMIDDWLQVSF